MCGETEGRVKAKERTQGCRSLRVVLVVKGRKQTQSVPCSSAGVLSSSAEQDQTAKSTAIEPEYDVNRVDRRAKQRSVGALRASRTMSRDVVSKEKREMESRQRKESADRSNVDATWAFNRSRLISAARQFSILRASSPSL